MCSLVSIELIAVSVKTSPRESGGPEPRSPSGSCDMRAVPLGFCQEALARNWLRTGARPCFRAVPRRSVVRRVLAVPVRCWSLGAALSWTP